MTNQEIYHSKLCTGEEIAALVQNGWHIGLDIGTMQSPGIINAICERAKTDDLSGVRIQSLLDVLPMAYCLDEQIASKVRGESWFCGGSVRKAVNAGMADFLPGYYHDFPGLIREFHDYDVYCVAVSPMDEEGYFTLGTGLSISEALLEKSKRIFVEVNNCVPRALNNRKIHVSEVTAILENNCALPVIPAKELDAISITIGNRIAELIPDGACIQLGIGAIPDATGAALKAKHDLGIHTEMFTDSMVELIACGAVNNSKKQIYPGKSVTTFAYGSQRIYDYIDNNPDFQFLPVDVCNDPNVICKNDNMISINAAIEVDFFGQVCAESVGTKVMSGSGGQVDYVRGATQSKGGKSFIAFTSTAKNGSVSKIKSTLTEGAVATTSKNDVDYIVTEYGIAHLRGQSLASRTKQLIAIAHPDFRDELTFAAKKRGILL